MLAGQPLRAQEMVLAVLVFSLTYPGSVPFRMYQPGFIRQLLGSWGLVIGLLLLFGLMIDALRQFDQNVLAAWTIATPLVQAAAHWVSPLTLRKLVALAPGADRDRRGRQQPRSRPRAHRSRKTRCRRPASWRSSTTARRTGWARSSRRRVAGGFGSVAQFVRANRVDQIFIALPMASQPRILRLLEELRDTTASIYFVPDIFMFDLIQARVDSVGGLPVVAVCESPFYGTTGVLKRLSDLIIALVALVFTAPVMTRHRPGGRLTSKGPVLFKQRRYGLDGSEINVYKFRTMRVQENGQRGSPGDEGRRPHHAGRARSCAALPWMNCRSSSTCSRGA